MGAGSAASAPHSASVCPRPLVRQHRLRAFLPPDPPPAQLTELKALLGAVAEKRYVLGFLSSPEDGRYAVEDLSARLPLDISGADCTQGLFTGTACWLSAGDWGGLAAGPSCHAQARCRHPTPAPRPVTPPRPLVPSQKTAS